MVNGLLIMNCERNVIKITVFTVHFKTFRYLKLYNCAI